MTIHGRPKFRCTAARRASIRRMTTPSAQGATPADAQAASTARSPTFRWRARGGSTRLWPTSLLAQGRAAPLVHRARKELDEKLEASLATADAAARAKFEAGDIEGGKEILDRHAIAAGGAATARWIELWKELIVTLVDGRVMTLDSSNEVCGCRKAPARFGDDWKGKVVEDTGAHYREPQCQAGRPAHPSACAAAAGSGVASVAPHGKPTRDKLTIRGVVS